MNHFLNKQQLAFLLDIKAEEARAKMCVAWCKSKGIENEAEENAKGKIVDPYPQAMTAEMLSEQLGIPTLVSSIEDIRDNYLKRPATKKWILCDFPEKQDKKAVESGKPTVLKIPPALKSMINKETNDTILKEWSERFPKAKLK